MITSFKIFENKYTNKFDFIPGKSYEYNELPKKVRDDIDVQFEDIFDLGPEDYNYIAKLLNPDEEYIFNIFEEDAMNHPYVKKLVRDIKNNGINYPSVGTEGNHRALACYMLNIPLPYLEMVLKPDRDPYNDEEEILEKTSLININVPFSVMKQLQKDYSISDNAQWKKLQYKREASTALHKPVNTLIISICKNKLVVLFSYNKNYYAETYILDDFDSTWEKLNRIQGSLTEILTRIGRGCKSYLLINGNWNPDYFKSRKIKKEQSDFEEITNKFKIEFIKKFANDFTRSNSLSSFDEKIIGFENDYSEKYKEYLNIHIMINKFGREKIMTAFMYYLHSNKLMEL